MKNQSNETLSLCPSCSSHDKTIYLSEDKYPIEKCNNCDLLFVNPRPTEKTIRNHFVNEYIKDTKRVERDFASYRKTSLAREASIIKKKLPHGGCLLDLGTASGEFLEFFKKKEGWSTIGIEPSKFAADAARKRTTAIIYTGFLDEQDLEQESFDVITSLDTFYFHSYPNKDLESIYKLMKPDGFLVVEIPNLSFRLIKNTGLLAKIIYRKNSRLNAGVHLFYYSRKTLGTLMKRHGLTLISFHPEQSPTYGNFLLRFLNKSYYLTTRMVYQLSGCKINLAPKEVLLYKKHFFKDVKSNK